MNKKLKYALIIVGLILTLALATLYIIFPTEFKDTTNYIWDKANTPLPIIGVSLVVVLVFVWKCFVASKFGKKALNDLKKENDNLRLDNSNFKEDTNNRISELENKIKQKDELIAQLCELSTNQKIKHFGKELLGHGEQTINNQPKEE